MVAVFASADICAFLYSSRTNREPGEERQDGEKRGKK
jgi:hypothetical protein